MEHPKIFFSDTVTSRLFPIGSEGQIEHLLPKFLLNDFEDSRFITDSTRDENLDINFSHFEVNDSQEEETILEAFKLKDVSNNKNNLF